MAKLKGEFDFTPEAREAYDDWYLPFRRSYEHKSDKSGISGRIHTSILKLSMILAVNYTCGLVVDTEHMLEAIKEGMALLPNYQSFIMSSGKSTVAEVASLLIEDIWTNKKKRVTKSDFLAKYIHIFDLELCDKCIATLSGADLIKMTLENGERESYQITEKCREKFGLV